MTRYAANFTDDTLELSTTDATRLLAAIGAVPEIRNTMYKNGMEDEDINEGAKLLLACLAIPRDSKAAPDTEQARAQRDAVVELDQWDEPNFRRYEAALVRKFPGQAEYVFDNLSASRGVEAVKGVATFLARIQALEEGSDSNRASTKKEDKKAVELLAKRGLTSEERKRLQKLVTLALGPTPPSEMPPVDETRRQSLLALKLWCNEWSAVAHAAIKKRAYLIRMGLAARRTPKTEETEPEAPK